MSLFYYPLYARYIQLYPCNKPCSYGIYCCSCSLFTICATCNVISPAQYVLYLYISTSHSLCAVPNMAAVRSFLIPCFPGPSLRYCLSDSEMVPVAPIVTGINFAFTFRMRRIYIVRSVYFRIFSVSVLITFLSAGIATSIDMHDPCLLSHIMMFSLLL